MKDNGILWGCCLGALCLIGILATTGKGEAPSLECSVDDTLTFVAYDVRRWNIELGTLWLLSAEDGQEFVMSRVLLAGETCKEVYEARP